MCQFCKEHGEGKKWYLEMKNYSRELLHENLTAEARGKAGTDTGAEWVDKRVENAPSSRRFPIHLYSVISKRSPLEGISLV